MRRVSALMLQESRSRVDPSADSAELMGVARVGLQCRFGFDSCRRAGRWNRMGPVSG